MTEKTILTVKETVERSRQKGMTISEYTLRRALHSGAIPCRVVGKKYLIAWANVERWLLCVEGSDNALDVEPKPDEYYGEIRPINL